MFPASLQNFITQYICVPHWGVKWSTSAHVLHLNTTLLIYKYNQRNRTEDPTVTSINPPCLQLMSYSGPRRQTCINATAETPPSVLFGTWMFELFGCSAIAAYQHNLKPPKTVRKVWGDLQWYIQSVTWLATKNGRYASYTGRYMMFRKYMYSEKWDGIYGDLCTLLLSFVVRSRQVMKSICWFDHAQIQSSPSYNPLKIMKILKW